MRGVRLGLPQPDQAGGLLPLRQGRAALQDPAKSRETIAATLERLKQQTGPKETADTETPTTTPSKDNNPA